MLKQSVHPILTSSIASFLPLHFLTAHVTFESLLKVV